MNTNRIAAGISAIATYFAMFPGFIGSVLYAAQELAIAIVFAAILISWIGLFNWLGEKLRMRSGDSRPWSRKRDSRA